MPETTVVNIRLDRCDIYVGRRRSRFHFGNPFGRKHESGGRTRSTVTDLKILDTTDRDATITAYRHWLLGYAHKEVDPDRRRWILNNIPHLKGKRLGCWCAPRTCHAEVLADLADHGPGDPDLPLPETAE